MALAAIRGEQTLIELSQQFDVHASQIKQWKDQLLDDDGTKGEPMGRAVDVKTLQARQQTAFALRSATDAGERFLSGTLGKAGLLGGKK